MDIKIVADMTLGLCDLLGKDINDVWENNTDQSIKDTFTLEEVKSAIEKMQNDPENNN